MTGEPQLKFEEARVVDCRTLDKFVAIHLEGYGVTWRSLDTNSDGYHNGSYQTADVKLGAEIENDMDQDFSSWLTGGDYYLNDEEGFMSREIPGIQEMMQWLCNLGKIPDGKYVVELWW